MFECLFLGPQFSATLSENCSLPGTENARGQIFGHICAPDRGYCLYMFVPIVMFELYKRVKYALSILLIITACNNLKVELLTSLLFYNSFFIDFSYFYNRQVNARMFSF